MATVTRRRAHQLLLLDELGELGVQVVPGEGGAGGRAHLVGYRVDLVEHGADLSEQLGVLDGLPYRSLAIHFPLPPGVDGRRLRGGGGQWTARR
jgi:hypothetical protein